MQFPLNRIQHERQQWQQGGETIGNLLAALINMIRQGGLKSEAEEAAGGYFTSNPTMGNPATIPVNGGGTAQLPRFTGVEQTPNFDALAQSLFSNNPYMKQNAGNALDFLKVKQGLQPQMKVLEGQTGEFLQYDPLNPSGTMRPIRSAPPKQIAPNLPEGFAQITDPATKAQIYNQTYGNNFPPSAFEQSKDPTELAKYQSELDKIKATNPSDPRIPQYEGVIKRLQVGVPYFRPVETGAGEFQTYDPKSGQFLGGTGQYKASPAEVRQQMSYLNDNLKSVKEIKEVMNLGSLTGAVTGRARQFGTRFFSDADATRLKNRLAQLRTVIYGLSGKQINESEQEWLKNEVLPEMKQPTENFEVTLEEFERWIQRRKQSIEEQFPAIRNTPQPIRTTNSRFKVIEIQ